MKAVRAYNSQFYNPKSNEPNTPISSKNFIDSIKLRDDNFGRISGVSAEGLQLKDHQLYKTLKEFYNK